MNFRSLFQLKYIPLWMYVLSLAFLIASFVNPGSGWGAACVGLASVATIWIGLTYVNTGEFFTDSSGGK